MIKVLALAWFGRGDCMAAEWTEALEAARAAQDERAAAHLLATPNPGDTIEERLAELGLSIIGEEGRL